MVQKAGQQCRFPLGKSAAPGRAVQRAGADLQTQIGKLQTVGLQGRGPPKQGADTRQQLLRRVGLGKVVVRPRVEAGHPVLHHAEGRQQQDGDFSTLLAVRI